MTLLFLNHLKLTTIERMILVTFVASGLLLSNAAFAQTSNEKLVQKLVDKNILTPEEAAQLLSADKPKAKPQTEQIRGLIRKGFNTPSLSFGGYGMLMYEYNSQSTAHNDFRPRVLFLWAEGKLNDHFRYFIMPEFVSPSLYEYYAEWMPSSAFKLKAGQFKVPFTLENPISLVNLESIQNTRTVASLAGMSSDVGANNGAGRDIGIQASGSFLKMTDHDLIQYSAGVFEGTGINTKENNNVKDFAGTLAVQPVKGWRLAGGLYAGQSLYVKSGQTASANHVRNRWALSSDYASDRIYARAEWVHGNDGGIEREGVYGIGSYYFIPKKLNSYARIDHYYNDKSLKQKAVDYSAGINYYFASLCRFQLNYQYSDYSKQCSGKKDTHSLLGELQLFF
jgi:Phosphate-selective porin O and P